MDLLSLHQRIYERTDGRLGHRMLGVPCLLLRSTGRRTGQIRTSALVYARDHGRYGGYQAKTERKIPLVVVTPAG